MTHPMTPAQRLPAVGAALLLLASCGGSGTPGSESTQSPSTPSTVSPSRSPSMSPSMSPESTAASPTASVEPSVTKPSVTKPSGSRPPVIEPLVVHIRNFAYVPAAPIVVVGQPIDIVNDDVAAHTWSAAPKVNWAYTSGNLEKGQRATFPGYPKPGSYKFLCYYHAEMPSMTGVVTVKAAP
jgi:plastocyanin